MTLITGTAALTLTAAVPANPPPTESDVIFSLDVASTETLPVTVMLPCLPMEAVGALVDDLDVDAGTDAGGAADGQLAGQGQDRRRVGGADRNGSRCR